jgi:ArsR family transcriptional regulator, arsenate/arsenite/antimonite-responsive transcriptional repressor
MAVDVAPPEDVADTAGVVEALKALAEPTRWRMVALLACEELCVCHLAEDLGIAQPLVSHHLKVLRAAGLVEPEKHRQWTYYRLRRGALEDLHGRLAAVTACCPAPGEKRRPCA